MALPEPHWYCIKHAPGIVARVTVNDVPFYRRVVQHHQSPSGPFNHLLLEGENQITIDIHEPEKSPVFIHTFELAVMRESDDAVIYREKYPDFLEEYPEEDRKLPFSHRRKFSFNQPSPKPIWQDAPRESFPTTGTEELHGAVLALHTAYAEKDIDAFLKAMELKTEEFQKFYGQEPDLAPDAARAKYGAQLQQDWDLEPYDPDEIVFERWADGRVAYATRLDGRPALMARHRTNPRMAWQANLLLTRAQGQWRIFW